MEGFGGTSVAVLAAGFVSILDMGFGEGFAAGFATGFAEGFAAGFASILDVGFAAGFATGFAEGFAGADFGGEGFTADVADVGLGDVGLTDARFAGVGLTGTAALNRRERMPFFSATGSHHLHEVRNATRVAPLVVIPRNHLGEGSIHHHGALRIDDRGSRITSEI